jgi:hypothetical protein
MDVLTYSFEGLKNRLPRVYHRQEILDIYVSSSSSSWHSKDVIECVISFDIKVTCVWYVRLCTGRTAHRGSRGIALLFLEHGTRRGRGVRVIPRSLFTPGKDPVPIAQEAGWAPEPVWTGAENLVPTEIRFPDRPARSHSLYRLSYPGPPHLV